MMGAEGKGRMYVFREERNFLLWDADERWEKNVRWYGWIKPRWWDKNRETIKGKNDISVHKKRKKRQGIYWYRN